MVANFIQSSTNYNVNTSSAPANGGSTTGSGSYANGSAVTVTATANNGYGFVNWTENSSIISTNSTYNFVISADRNLVANFIQSSTNYSVNAACNPVNGGFTTGTGSYADGSTVTVTATPNNGYGFINWTENNNVVSTDSIYTFTITSDRTLEANFDLELGVNLVQTPNSIVIYPNPANDKLYIANTSLPASTIAWVYNATGQSISCPVNNNIIPVSHLPNGIYTLQLWVSGQYVYCKFIKNE